MYLGLVPLPNGGSSRGSSYAYRASPAIVTVPKGVLPAPRPPIIVVGTRIYTPPVPVGVMPTPTPKPAVPNPNAGTPVPAGYPTNQLFVNSDGSFWEYGANGWVNVGTPYGTGASATPPAPPPSPAGGSTAPPAGVAAPVSVSVAGPSTGYQEILDWLQKDSLLASLGFAKIPNWVTAGGVAVLGYRLTGKSGRK